MYFRSSISSVDTSSGCFPCAFKKIRVAPSSNFNSGTSSQAIRNVYRYRSIKRCNHTDQYFIQQIKIHRPRWQQFTINDSLIQPASFRKIVCILLLCLDFIYHIIFIHGIYIQADLPVFGRSSLFLLCLRRMFQNPPLPHQTGICPASLILLMVFFGS